MKAYLWDKKIRVTLKARGVQETVKCGPGKKEMKNLDGTLFSMPRETESTRERSFRTSKINSDTMNASWKYRSTTVARTRSENDVVPMDVSVIKGKGGKGKDGKGKEGKSKEGKGKTKAKEDKDKFDSKSNPNKFKKCFYCDKVGTCQS